MSESKANNMNVRNYQAQLAQYLSQRNGIVYLPTGTGKTYVAILAIKRFSHDFDKPITAGGKRAIFACNTVELARQQALYVKRTTNLTVGFYVGEHGVDFWDANKWNQEISKNQVLVGTAQVILDLLMKKILKFQQVSIIVFDECHHATGRHPYHEIMYLMYLEPSNTTLPRVVGLTGVLVKGNEIKNVCKLLKELEATFRALIITVSEEKELANIMLYATKPVEAIVWYDNPINQITVIETIRINIHNFIVKMKSIDIGHQPVRMSKNLRTLKDPSKKSGVQTLLLDFMFQMDTYGVYTASIAIVSLLIEFQMKLRQSETSLLKNFYRSVITLCDLIRHLLVTKLRDLVDDDAVADDDINSSEIIMNFSTPMMQKFLLYIKNTFGNKKPDDICCLVFVERRYTSKCIYGTLVKFIESTPELRNVLVPQFMVGRNTISDSFELGLERKWQKKAIQQFRDKEANLMVCSSVLEEGIDVQACNYVIMLDPIKTFNMYVQTKGRARSKNASYVIFALGTADNKMKTANQITEYRSTHSKIAEYLSDRVLDREDPSFNDISDHFQDAIKPYITPGGSVLLTSSALSLLSRYCQQLPTDVFGTILPWFQLLQPEETKRFTKQTDMYIVSLQLPITSPIRETIYSDPMVSSRLAKISAAFKACVLLYKANEITDRLLPKTSIDCIAEVANEHFEHWKNFGDDVTNIKKDDGNIKTYASKCPIELCDAMPRVGETCYLYEIKFKVQFDRNSYTDYMYDALSSPHNYGLLLRKRLPHLASMPLFCHQGELEVQVSDDPLKIIIENEEQLRQLHRFHVMIFRDILRIWQPFFVFDRRSQENSFLIAPLSKSVPSDGLDWQFIQQFQQLPKPRAFNLVERNALPPCPKDFEGKIVTQWYSNYDQRRMVVTKVHTDISPMSLMDSTSLQQTYYDFTMSKYKQHIGDVLYKNEFLIEVREITSQLNFYVKQSVKTGKQKIRGIRLIPELCFNFGFPGDLWIKFIFLPSILRRVYYMLHAETLRVRINEYLGLDKLPINSINYHPKKLQIDVSLKRNVDQDGNAIESGDTEEQRTVLDPLPTKSIVNDMRKLKISDMTTSYQDYAEPIDIYRNTMSMYKVELSYYSNFIRNHESASDAESELVEANDFKMISSNIYDRPPVHNKTMPSLLPSTGDDIPDNSHVKLTILQKTFSNQQITAAEQFEYLAAITAAGSVDVFDMERLELLGDCFLKLSAALYLSHKYPTWKEGELTKVKSTMVSNRNLLYCLSQTDIPTRISSTLFSPKYAWMPPSITLPRNVLAIWKENPDIACLVGPHNLHSLSITEEEIFGNGECEKDTVNSFLEGCQSNRQSSYHNSRDFSVETNFCIGQVSMPKKVISDTLEAILGVVVKNYGLQHAFRMLEYFQICRPNKDKPLTQLLDLQLGGSRMRANVSQKEIDGFLINYTFLERNIGYTFKDRAYLLQALTHPSFPTNRITGCYQQLEFVGDAILDFLVSAFIFEHQTTKTPGELTDLRSALVNNATLACICVRHRLHSFILAENALLSEAILKFEMFQVSQKHRVTSHVHILLEESDVTRQEDILDSDDGLEFSKEDITESKDKIAACNISQNVEVPKVLGDVVEALIAAIYLDCRSLETTWQVVYGLLRPELEEFSNNVPINPIRQIMEHKSAKAFFSAPIVDKDMVMVSCQFICMENTMTCHGFGSNKDQAKLSAAKHALLKLSKCEA